VTPFLVGVGTELSKQPFVYKIWRFSVVNSKAHHWAYSWASSIDFTSSKPLSVRSNFILQDLRFLYWWRFK